MIRIVMECVGGKGKKRKEKRKKPIKKQAPAKRQKKT